MLGSLAPSSAAQHVAASHTVEPADSIMQWQQCPDTPSGGCYTTHPPGCMRLDAAVVGAAGATSPIAWTGCNGHGTACDVSQSLVYHLIRTHQVR